MTASFALDLGTFLSLIKHQLKSASAKPRCAGFRLNPGQVVALNPRQDSELRATCCRLWLTRADDTMDYFLAPGETLKLGAGERWVAEALGSAQKDGLNIPARFEIDVLKPNQPTAIVLSTSNAMTSGVVEQHDSSINSWRTAPDSHWEHRPSRSAVHAAMQLHLSLRA
jgi:hypothetical protein